MAIRALHSISGRLRRHDWFGAAVDFAMVAAGVFLGIEAANWNDERKNRAEERRYYAQIVDDLRTDVRTLATAERRSRLNDASAERTLNAVRSGSLGRSSPGRFALDIHYAGFLFLPRPARGTYDELISTGSVGLMQNDAAKRAIADYYSGFETNRQWDALLREQQAEYWTESAGVLPRSVLRDAIRGREPRLSPDSGAQILAALRSRPRLEDLLIGMAAHQERVRRDSEQQAREARDLIALLEPLAR